MFQYNTCAIITGVWSYSSRIMHAQSTHLENVLCALLNSACVLFEKGALLTHSCCVLFHKQKEVILGCYLNTSGNTGK